MKYIHFPTHPLFTPMVNPMEMLKLGVYGGSAFKNQKDLKDKYPGMPWDKTNWGQLYDPEKNYFKVAPDHSFYKLHNYGEIWTPQKWFRWYTDLYFHPLESGDNDQDYFQIVIQ